MFIGHFAVGLGAKAINPKASLGTYFLAAQFVDLLWPTLLLVGAEQVVIAPGITAVTPLDFVHYPYTHSLFMAFAWSIAAFILMYALRRDVGVSLLVGLCVGSHWVLDLITHRPDLPLSLNETTKVGLGLWNNVVLTVVIEVLLYAAAIAFYLMKTKATDGVGKYGFWGLIAFMLFIYIGNLFGPPPPSANAIAWAGQLQWLLIVWGYWVDRHRVSLQS